MSQILAPAFDMPRAVLARAANIKLVLFDVDGVLTDGRLLLGDDGQEYKAFNSKGWPRYQNARPSRRGHRHHHRPYLKVVEHRVRDLKIEHVYQGCAEKLPVYRQLLAKLGLQPEQTAFVGDDVVDLPIMLNVGLAVAPRDAHPLVIQHAHWTTPSAGGPRRRARTVRAHPARAGKL